MPNSLMLSLEKLKSLKENYPKYITLKCQLEQINLQIPQLSMEKLLLEDKKNELNQRHLYLLMIKKFNLPGLRFIGISLTDKGSASPKIHYDVGDFQEQKLA